MEEKIKYIIVGLIIIIGVSLFLNLQTHTAKKNLEREGNALKNENETLTKSIAEALKDNQQLKERIGALNGDLERISQEKQEFQRQKEGIQERYDSIIKERDELVGKLKIQPEKGLGKEPTPQIEDTYWSRILKAKMELESQIEKIQSELKTTKIRNEDLQREKTSLELDLKNITREKQDLESQMGYNQKTLDSMYSELALEKNMKRQLQGSLKSIKDENALLRRQLKSLSKHKVNLEEKLVKLQGENSTLERRFNEMAALLEDRLSNIGEIKQQLGVISSGGKIEEEEIAQPKKESVELPPIVVRPQTEMRAPEITTALMGNILSVDKDNNFVIIDLGEDTGTKVGDTFQVYRGDRVIATIEVIQARRDIAACDIKKEIMPIRAGDMVR